MPLDVLGCKRHAMPIQTRLLVRKDVPIVVKIWPGWDRGLEFFLVNAEHLVVVVHDAATNTSLPFVHTARRYCRHRIGAR